MADFVWRIGNFSNIPTLVSQHSYQISSQTRWHPLASDKTLLQKKYLRESPTDNREIKVNVLTIIPYGAIHL